MHGVTAAMSLGLDRWDVDPEMYARLGHEIIPNAARFLTVGRGIAATPMAGPPLEYRLGIPPMERRPKPKAEPSCAS